VPRLEDAAGPPVITYNAPPSIGIQVFEECLEEAVRRFGIFQFLR
jgi:hypothetical protein